MEQAIAEEGSKGFDVKGLLIKLGKNFYWFFITIALFGTAAYVYLYYTVPQYVVSNSVLIKQPDENANKLGSPFAAGGNPAGDVGADMGNEILKFQSEKLIGNVVDSLQMSVLITRDFESKKIPIIESDLPFAVALKKGANENESAVYKLTLQQNTYRLQSETKTLHGTFNRPLLIGNDTLTLYSKPSTATSNATEYNFQYLPRTVAIKNFLARLTIVPAGDNILQVSVNDEIPDRAKEAIGVLIHYYDIANLDYSNQSLKKEMTFLSDRLAQATGELEQQEKMVRDFKSSNTIYDVSASATQILSGLPTINTKRNDNQLKSQLLGLVESNITNGKEEVIPNSNSLQDPALSNQINTYNQLVLQKKAILENGKPGDLRLPNINSNIAEARGNISKSITNMRSEISVDNSSLNSQERTLTGQFSTMPAKEKELAELTRVLDVKQSVFTYMLQKKEEKEMELASTQIANSRIIDNAGGSITQFPPPLYVYAIAFAAALLLPALIIVARFMMRDKIESRKDIESLTTLPIAGQIGNVQKKDIDIVITSENNSIEAEQFRTLRTNIYYLAAGLKQKTLMVTSSKSGEGKSFISLNLANSIAITNKKVALLEFDLRKNGLGEKLGLENTVGLANYLNGEVEIDEIIQHTPNSENLFFLSSGSPLSANPGEMILSDKVGELFAYLKKNFDVIIMDTPPIGPVSDAISLGKWADRSFFVIRHKHTLMSTLKLINKLKEEEKIPNLTLIVNGIKNDKEFNYGNDFGYGYGYQPQKRKRYLSAN